MIIDLLCHSPVSQDKNELLFFCLLALNYYTFDNVGRQKYCYHEMNDAYLTLSSSTTTRRKLCKHPRSGCKLFNA